MKMYVWSRQPAFIAVAQADSVDGARKALLAEIGGSDGSCEYCEEAVQRIMNSTPTIWQGVNAEFAITDSAELARCERERTELLTVLKGILETSTVLNMTVDIAPWLIEAKRLLKTVPFTALPQTPNVEQADPVQDATLTEAETK